MAAETLSQELRGATHLASSTTCGICICVTWTARSICATQSWSPSGARALLSVDGRLFRQPLIEPIPAYRSSNHTFQEIAQARFGGSWSTTDIIELADFVSLELFPPSRSSYVHQDEVFAESVVGGNDVIVTTGTGPGKPNAFLCL